MNIRCKHDGGKRVLRGVDSQTSIADLQLRVRKEMDIPLADDVALLVGFPPTPLLVDGLELTSRLASTALRDGDTITVKGKGTGVSEGVGRSRRAAPTKKRAASRSGGNLGISARSPQDKRVRRVRPTAGGVTTVGPRAGSSGRTSAFDPDYTPDAHEESDDERAPRVRRRKKMTTPAKPKTKTMAAPRPLAPPRPLPARADRASSEASAGLAALGPVAGSGGSAALGGGAIGSAIAYLRKAARADVAQAEAIATANWRLRAAMSGAWRSRRATPPDGRRTGAAGEAEQHFIKVAFRHGERANAHWVFEVVELFAEPDILAFLRHVVAQPDASVERENLRMFKMAQCSPRVFWSIATLLAPTRAPAGALAVVGAEADADAARGALHEALDVETVMQRLMPGADWSFLAHRRRTRSSKARLNDAQMAQDGGAAGEPNAAPSIARDGVEAAYAATIAGARERDAVLAAAQRAEARAKRLAALGVSAGAEGSALAASAARAGAATPDAAAPGTVVDIMGSSEAAAAALADGVDSVVALAARSGLDQGAFKLRQAVRKAARAAPSGSDFAQRFSRLSEDAVQVWIDAAVAALARAP